MSEGRTIQRVGVVGAGTMGNGIAHVFSMAGLDVLLVDVDAGVLEGAIGTIKGNLQRQVKKEKISAGDAEGALALIRTTTDPAGLNDAQLVVEAVPERAELKHDIFARLGEVSGPETILATNTSSISITEIASGVESPDRVVGMHFMNPVPVMKLVEVIRGLETSDATTEATVALCERLGKTPVEVNDFPGFVSNRILMPMINEAVFCLMEGVADPEAIDTVMKLGMNHPMGPLALADLIWLDTFFIILEILHRELGDDIYLPSPLLRK